MNKWISVKDRLPEKCGVYLTTAGDGGYCIQRYALDPLMEKITWIEGEYDYEPEQITYWRELPELPSS